MKHENADYVRFSESRAELRALAAVEVALWDIATKFASEPLFDLLSRRTHDKTQIDNGMITDSNQQDLDPSLGKDLLPYILNRPDVVQRIAKAIQ